MASCLLAIEESITRVFIDFPAGIAEFQVFLICIVRFRFWGLIRFVSNKFKTNNMN